MIRVRIDPRSNDKSAGGAGAVRWLLTKAAAGVKPKTGFLIFSSGWC